MIKSNDINELDKVSNCEKQHAKLEQQLRHQKARKGKVGEFIYVLLIRESH